MTDGHSTAGSAPAVLFDIDGTLVDSNYLHVHAWHRSFADESLTVESWRVHRCIGMDGSTLLDTLVPDVDEDARNRLKDGHSRYYLDAKGLLQLLPGARELLEDLALLSRGEPPEHAGGYVDENVFETLSAGQTVGGGDGGLGVRASVAANPDAATPTATLAIVGWVVAGVSILFNLILLASR